MTRTFLEGFKIMKDNKVVDEFTYYRRGNIYEIFNNSGTLFSKDSYTEAEERWNKILSIANGIKKMTGFEIIIL